MPTIPPAHTLLTESLVNRQATASSDSALQVVCAWPVSGQYGPGSRVLYYALVAACVLGQEAELIRSACLAAALIFPAVAAIHGIVLAAVHVDGAVDLDIYGAFQLCAVGILAAPVTVRLSRRYFDGPGRNIIFVWSGLILAGLLSITVEFYRVAASSCPRATFWTLRTFPYGNTTCGLICSVEDGPFSPIRGGSGNNIYVVPTPDKLLFGLGTLLAAACCIPAVLLLVNIYIKILETNWRKLFEDPASGANRRTHKVAHLVRKYLAVPLFSAALLAVLILGERNLFSQQLRYQSEPLSSVGQWAPIAGTALALFGGLYVLLENAMEQEAAQMEREADLLLHNADVGESTTHTHTPNPVPGSDSGGARDTILPIEKPSVLRRVAKRLLRFKFYFGNPAQKRFDISKFRQGPANDFPMVPAELQRDGELASKMERWKSSDGTSMNSGRPSRAPSQDGRNESENNPALGHVTTIHTRERRDTLEVPQSPIHTRRDRGFSGTSILAPLDVTFTLAGPDSYSTSPTRIDDIDDIGMMPIASEDHRPKV